MAIERVLVVALALVGFYIAMYFTLVTYRVVPVNTRLVPSFCRMEEGICTSIIQSSYARALFGIPNSLLGILYYLAIVLAVATGILVHPTVLLAFRLVAWIAVALGLYLIYGLFVVLRTPCPLCLASHGINLALAVLLLLL